MNLGTSLHRWTDDGSLQNNCLFQLALLYVKSILSTEVFAKLCEYYWLPTDVAPGIFLRGLTVMTKGLNCGFRVL